MAMRYKLVASALWALVALASARSVAAEKIEFQPLGPGYEGCGCSLVNGPLFSNADVLLFQDFDDAATTTVRLGGKNIRLKPSAGALFAEWGSKVGDPVAAEFSGQGHRVEFNGKVINTCYDSESCEAIWYEGVLRASSAGQSTSEKVTGACGC